MPQSDQNDAEAVSSGGNPTAPVIGVMNEAKQYYTDVVKATDEVLAETKHKESLGYVLNAVAADLDVAFQTFEDAFDTARDKIDSLTKLATEWDDRFSKMKAGDVKEAFKVEAEVYNTAASLMVQAGVPGADSMAASAAFLESTTAMTMDIAKIDKMQVGQAFMSTMNGALHQLIDGTPAAFVFGAVNGMVKSVTGKTMEEWATHLLSKALGEAAAAAPVLGWAVQMVTAISSFMDARSEVGRQEVIRHSKKFAEREAAKLGFIFGQAKSVNNVAQLTKVGSLIGQPDKARWARVEGDLLWATATGRVLRSLAMGDVFYRPVYDHTYASYGGGSGMDEDSDEGAEMYRARALLLKQSNSYREIRDERGTFRTTLEISGIAGRIYNPGSTLATALDGGRNDALAVLGPLRAMWRKRRIPPSEVLLACVHYTRFFIASESHQAKRWDGAKTATPLFFIEDATEVNEIADSNSLAQSMARAAALYSVVVNILD